MGTLLLLTDEVVTSERSINIGCIDTRFKFPPPEGCGVIGWRFFITVKLVTVALVEQLTASLLKYSRVIQIK